ncbi:TetR/AcrR family transcriptional regulator [Streptosporangium sp. CA-135522]|uniref:TetR/AcrR family transcriptional regulator n=1 Tax=Streptosporangium sp. CA-135522 TaxID=3240072 RepID=UPI003D93DDB2
MGVPEDLLAAAKQCLAERGYARTTVRDIVAVSGSNLAAINYHFRSKDALLNRAMIEATGEAVQEVVKALAENSRGDQGERLEAFWAELIESFRDKRALWLTNVDTLAQAPHSPEVRAQLADGQTRARAELGRLLQQNGDEASAVLVTLLIGMLVQWAVDPDSAPTAQDLSRGIRAIATATATGT